MNAIPDEAQAASAEEVRQGWLTTLADKAFGYDFFIAYAWVDARTYAVELARQLRARRRVCFIDSQDFIPGEALTSATRRALKRSKTLVLVGSRAALTRRSVMAELEIFFQSKRTIIPIDLGGFVEGPQYAAIRNHLSHDTLFIREEPSRLSIGPSKTTIDDVLRSFTGTTQERKRARLVGSAISTLSLLLVASLGLGIAAEMQREQAVVQRNLALSQANKSRANLAVSLGNRALQTDPALAVAFGLQSLSLSPNQGAQTLIGDAIRELPSYAVWSHPAAQSSEVRSLLYEKPLLQGAGFVGEGHTLAILDKDGALYLWNMTTEDSASRRIALSGVQEMALSKQQQRLAVLERNGSIELFKLDSESRLLPLKHMQGSFSHVVLSPDGEWVAGLGDITALANGNDSSAPIVLRSEQSVAAAFSKDDEWLFVADQLGNVRKFRMSGMTETASVHSTALGERQPGYWLLDDEERELEAEDNVKKATAAGAPKQQLRDLAALVQKATEAKSRDRRDLLGFPLPDLTITGVMTELIMETDKLSQKKRAAIRLYAGPDPDTVILVSDDEYLSEVEVWDLHSKARVVYKRGAFSKVTVADDGKEFAVATPSALGRFAVSRGTDLAVTEQHIWSPTRGPERLGEPVGIWYSSRSHFLASAHSPALKMEGAEASSVSLWYSEGIDSRDGDPHRGQRLRPSLTKIVTLSFSSDSTLVATADSDGRVRMWKIASEIALFEGGRLADGISLLERPGDAASVAPVVAVQGVNGAVAQFTFSGLRFTPEEGIRYLTTRFHDYAELRSAAEEMTEIRLDRAEIARMGLDTLTPGSNITMPAEPRITYQWKVAAGFDERNGRYDPTFVKAFEDLCRDIRRQHLDDDKIGARLASVLVDNPFLLSGMQIAWAAEALSSSQGERLNDLLMVLALSGDRSADPLLTSPKAIQGADAAVLDWARGFLRRQGRDTSADFDSNPDTLTFATFLAYPKVASDYFNFDALRLDKLSEEARKAAAEYQSFEPHRSMAAGAFAIAAAGKGRGRLIATIGELAKNEGHLDAAERFANSAISIDPSEVYAWNLLGNVRLDNGEYKAAIDAYAKESQLGRHDGWPEANTALAYERLGQLDTAEAMYRAAVASTGKGHYSANRATFLNGLAWFLLERRGPGVAHDHEAYELSQEANELTQYRDSNFLDAYALAAARAGKFGQAAELEQRALELLPEASRAEREDYKKKLDDYLRQKTW